MPLKKKLARVNKVQIAEKAWELTYLKETAFTADALAKLLKMPANRHFRQYLNELAKKGLLSVHRTLCDDAKWRKFYYAQKTQAMFTFDEKEKVA